MHHKPHKLHPVGDWPPQPLSPDDDEILKRAIADSDWLAQAVIEDIRRLREGRPGQREG